MDAIQLIALIITIGGALISLIWGVVVHGKLAIQIGSVFLMLVGIIVIVGYLAGDPKIYTVPPTGIGMAFSTGICFFVVGALILRLVQEVDFKK